MTDKPARCVLCGQDDSAAPLIPFDFRGRRHAICSQHLPVLIHDPARLAAQLPGAEDVPRATHKD
jgi:hypothetical protein